MKQIGQEIGLLNKGIIRIQHILVPNLLQIVTGLDLGNLLGQIQGRHHLLEIVDKETKTLTIQIDKTIIMMGIRTWVLGEKLHFKRMKDKKTKKKISKRTNQAGTKVQMNNPIISHLEIAKVIRIILKSRDPQTKTGDFPQTLPQIDLIIMKEIIHNRMRGHIVEKVEKKEGKVIIIGHIITGSENKVDQGKFLHHRKKGKILDNTNMSIIPHKI